MGGMQTSHLTEHVCLQTTVQEERCPHGHRTLVGRFWTQISRDTGVACAGKADPRIAEGGLPNAEGHVPGICPQGQGATPCRHAAWLRESQEHLHLWFRLPDGHPHSGGTSSIPASLSAGRSFRGVCTKSRSTCAGDPGSCTTSHVCRCRGAPACSLTCSADACTMQGDHQQPDAATSCMHACAVWRQLGRGGARCRASSASVGWVSASTPHTMLCQ